MALGVLLGRLAGFAREILLAHALGIGREADLAAFAMTLPDAVTNLLVGGAMGAALVPEFKAFQAKGARPARALFAHSTLAAIAAFGLLAGLVALAGPLVVELLAPGFAGADVPLAARLLRASVIAVPFTAAAAVSTAFLNAHGRFATAAFGTLLFNGVVIGAILGWTRPEELLPLALGVAVASAARWGTQLADAGTFPRPPGEEPAARGWTVSRGLVARYLQALGALGFAILVPVVGRALASLHDPGSVAVFNYATRLVELPMGIAVGVLSVVLLPRFSELFVAGKEAEALELARQGCWLVWAMALPLCLSMAWFSVPLVALLFGHGALGAEDARRIGELAAWAMLALPAMGQGVLLFSALSARGDTRRPFAWGAAIFLAYGILAWQGQRRWGLAGLVGAGVVLHWATAAAYAGILSRRHGFPVLSGGLARDLALASLLSAAAVAPFALLGGRSPAPLPGTLLALAAAAAALGAVALPRYKTLPGGLRTFYKERA